MESARIIINNIVRSKAPSLFVESRLIRDTHISFASPDLEGRKLEMIAQWANVTEKQLTSNSLLNTYRDLQTTGWRSTNASCGGGFADPKHTKRAVPQCEFGGRCRKYCFP